MNGPRYCRRIHSKRMGNSCCPSAYCASRSMLPVSNYPQPGSAMQSIGTTLKFALLGLLWLSTAAVHADTRLDWDKLNRLVPAWPIVDVPDAIPSKLIAHWESKAVSFRCPSIPGSFDSFPTKYDPNSPNGGCNHLDATLFNGLLCASGFEDGCRAVQQAQ